MKIYSIRHGQTNMNIRGIYNGLIDEDINEEGIRQATIARNTLRDKDIDLIFCSPLLRTRHTGEIINEKNVPIIYDNRLLERTLGKIDGKRMEDEGITKKIFHDYSHKFEDENMEDIPTVFKRVHNFLDEIISKYNDKNVLIITHGAIMRAIYFYFNEIPEDKNMLVYGAKNCQINEYDTEMLKAKKTESGPLGYLKCQVPEIDLSKFLRKNSEMQKDSIKDEEKNADNDIEK